MPRLLRTGACGIRTLYCNVRPGSNLDPLDVLECLREEDAPLAAVQQVVMELLAGHTHRARHGTLLRSLRRADSLAAAATRAQVCGKLDLPAQVLSTAYVMAFEDVYNCIV
jgi:hypothetical protein